MYYLMLAAGLVLAGMAQRPGIVLMASSACALLLAWTVVRGERTVALGKRNSEQA